MPTDAEDFEKTGREIGGRLGQLIGWCPPRYRKALVACLAALAWTAGGDPMGLGPRQAAAWFNQPTVDAMQARMDARLGPMDTTLKAVSQAVINLYDVTAEMTDFQRAAAAVEQERARATARLKAKLKVIPPTLRSEYTGTSTFPEREDRGAADPFSGAIFPSGNNPAALVPTRAL